MFKKKSHLHENNIKFMKQRNNSALKILFYILYCILKSYSFPSSNIMYRIYFYMYRKNFIPFVLCILSSFIFKIKYSLFHFYFFIIILDATKKIHWNVSCTLLNFFHLLNISYFVFILIVIMIMITMMKMKLMTIAYSLRRLEYSTYNVLYMRFYNWWWCAFYYYYPLFNKKVENDQHT